MNSIVVILNSELDSSDDIEEIVGLLVTNTSIKDIRLLVLRPHEFGFMIKAIEEDLREN
jgi:hypothetical protein